MNGQMLSVLSSFPAPPFIEAKFKESSQRVLITKLGRVLGILIAAGQRRKKTRLLVNLISRTQKFESFAMDIVPLGTHRPLSDASIPTEGMGWA